MGTTDKTKITVETTVNVTVEKAWEHWTNPQHITKWNHASDDWHTTKAENDLRVGGKFSSRMEAKDGSFGFDFSGVYNDIKIYELIAYTMDDGRTNKITFISKDSQTQVIETFDAENENPIELQRGGWQAILDNFKKYVEAQ